KTQVVFDLSSFQLQTTDKKWFQGNRIMRNLSELKLDMDSLRREVLSQRLNYYLGKPNHFVFYLRQDSVTLPPDIYKFRKHRDSVARLPYAERGRLAGGAIKKPEPTGKSDSVVLRTDSIRMKREMAKRSKALTNRPKESKLKRDETTSPKKKVDTTKVAFDSAQLAKIDSLFGLTPSRDVLQGAANTARQIKSQVGNSNSSVDTYQKELTVFEIQWHKILASSLACVAMFLIGAPLGAIIKKGGLGVPFLVSILFFIIYYVLTMQGEKVAKQGTIPPWAGVWIADLILFVVGLIFLRQARIDARLFESDFYAVVLEKAKRWLADRRQSRLKTT
ncbi:MAG TPA: LptF/LptG family permease, partial [Chryseolinea sp.]